MSSREGRLPEDHFLAIRQKILQGWPTGRDVDLTEAVDYHHRLPAEKIFAPRLAAAAAAGITLTQPRAGVAGVAEHIALLRCLETEGEADLLPTTIDSYTRHNRYGEAEQGLAESRQAGRSLLNGFPAVNHGVALCRQVNESVQSPTQVRHGTPDARLLAEICLAGGFTSFEGGGISYNIPYAKNHPLEKSIADWQYVDRLVGLYEEAGVHVNREPFGPLTGTLVPPCMSHAVAVLEALLAAEQGVKSITVGYGQVGNLIQDVAAVKTLATLTEQYLARFGYRDVEVTTVFHQWMGGFPPDEAKAYGVISLGALTAALAGATKVIVKSPHEALGIPSPEVNAAGLRCTKQVLRMYGEQAFPETPALTEEMAIISGETSLLLDKSLELGDGDAALGAVRAFAAGVLDVPFAPSRASRGLALPARDNNGAIRFLDTGNLPFDRELKEFHRAKLAQRGRSERRPADFTMVIDDVYAVSRGYLVGRPE